jgi:hypothetical protein
MTTLVYTEEEFKVMIPVFEQLQKAKNITEMKKCKKAIASFITLMSSIYKTEWPTSKEFEVLSITKCVRFENFPVEVFYGINIDEVQK